MFSTPPPPRLNVDLTAISIIIPLYNTEKFIGQCLQSVLNQTFQNFEVLVIDDCSTDNSVAEVEKFIPKFNGKLRLIKRNKNSGGGGNIPRNIGMKLSRGKYIYFLDSDDLIINTALTDLYEIAEKTQADVLHADRYFQTGEIENGTDYKMIDSKFSENEIHFEPEDLSERMMLYCESNYRWEVWNKFFRRDFLMENDIEFPNLPIGGDMIFHFKYLCLAKKYVRIPNAFYIYRYRSDSVTNEQISPQKRFDRSMKYLLGSMKVVDDFMDSMEFFVNNKDIRQFVLHFITQEKLSYFLPFYSNIQPYLLQDYAKNKFSINPNDNIALTTYLFGLSIIQRLQIKKLQQENQNLIEQLKIFQQKREEVIT